MGIHNLEVMGWALQMRWLWIEKTKPERPWAGLEIPVHMHKSAMFAISVVTSVGNSENTMFWTDHWIHGCSLQDLAPNVLKECSSKIEEQKNCSRGLP